MTDVAEKLATRLERMDNTLASVLSIHLFVENLLNELIASRSAIAARVLDDHRTYTFSVKLALAFHIAPLERNLFDNLTRLNSLRNLYAHKLDVSLEKDAKLDQYRDRDGTPLFRDVQSDLDEILNLVKEVLFRIKGCTFDWLHAVLRSEPARGQH